MNQDKRPVSLEDLLRLKRAERPPPEFWNDFDRQLRAKQLAALVEKRPWWHGLQHAFFRFNRYHAAIGTAAVVALVFVAKQDEAAPASPSAPSSLAGVADASRANPAPASDARIGAKNASVAKATQRGVEALEPSAAVAVANSTSLLGTSVIESDAQQGESVSPVEAITASRLEVESPSPSARFIAANFAAAQSVEPISVPLLASSQGFESRALPARTATVEPLQQISPPGESRRSSRYLAAMVSMTFDDRASRTTERAASRISPEELYDQVRRIGTRQGGLNVKF